jgi:hypothetical protein
MYDVNPLGPIMHLRELDRQKVRSRTTEGLQEQGVSRRQG